MDKLRKVQLLRPVMIALFAAGFVSLAGGAWWSWQLQRRVEPANVGGQRVDRIAVLERQVEELRAQLAAAERRAGETVRNTELQAPE